MWALVFCCCRTVRSWCVEKEDESSGRLWLTSYAPLYVLLLSKSNGLTPLGFAQAGPLLGTAILLVVCLQALLTAFFVLRTCQRVTWISTTLQRLSRHDSIRQDDDHLASAKLELSFLTRYFLGRRGCWFFTLTTCLDLYAISWTNASVFAQALADQWVIEKNTSFLSDRQIYGILFMVIAIPLSCSYLLDQLYLQLAFFGARLLMVLFMIGTLIHAFVHSDDTIFDDQPGGVTDDPPALVQWSGFLTMLTLAIFSTAFQFSVPFISSSTQLAKRGYCAKRPSGIFFYAVLFIFGTNAVLSLFMLLYFGENTESSSNLNWNSYRHGDRFVGKFIVLFAALDGLAVYPLLSLTLGDILMHAYYSELSEEEIQELSGNWKKRLPFCLVASIPQAVAALFVSDLPTLASLGVIFTLLSYTACPSLLYLASGKRVRGVLRMSKEGGIQRRLRKTGWFKKTPSNKVDMYPATQTSLVEESDEEAESSDNDEHDSNEAKELHKEEEDTVPETMPRGRRSSFFIRNSDKSSEPLGDLDTSRTSREISLRLSLAATKLVDFKFDDSRSMASAEFLAATHNTGGRGSARFRGGGLRSSIRQSLTLGASAASGGVRASIRQSLLLFDESEDGNDDDEIGPDKASCIEKEVTSVTNLDWAAALLLVVTSGIIVSIIVGFALGDL
mmetsp:Transcript_4630/g.10435  ORF Transcript_4630/g.10435 Transcript_4630/m.10435 type:complete len:673 (-) Transcript_4630:24-2042(-)